MPDGHNIMPLLPGVRKKIFLHPCCVQNLEGAFRVCGCQSSQLLSLRHHPKAPELSAIPIPGS